MTASVIQTLLSGNLLAKSLPSQWDDWIAELYHVGESLDVGRISGPQWQREMDRLYGTCNLDTLLIHLDIDKVIAAIDLSDRGEQFVSTPLLDAPRRRIVAGHREGEGVITQIGATRRGNAIPPHGHQNMASAFLILSGEYHVRQYDKLRTIGEIRPGRGSLLMRLAKDERQRRGQWSSVSDESDNIHWLRAASDDCFFFSTKLISLKPRLELHDRIHVDVNVAEDLGRGLVNAPIISDRRAVEKYG